MLKMSINPSRAVLFHAADDAFARSLDSGLRTQVANNDRANLQMSKKAKRRLQKAINWMTYLSAKRKVRLPDGRVIPKFQISFVTLTLPTKQMHSHKEIKSKCLNRFLTVARQKWGLKNFVWKLELQKNGNCHFHLTFDIYVPWYQIRREWNAAIAKLGYIQAYSDTFCRMSFDEYDYWRHQQGSTDSNKNYSAYTKGQADRWTNPNTTDVQSVRDVRNLAAYLSKYLTKPPCEEEATGLIADSAEELTGRLWFCSQSLSGLGNCVVDYSTQIQHVVSLLRRLPKIFTFQSDWVEFFGFSISKLPPKLAEWLRQAMVSFAVERGYPFSSSYLRAGL